MIAKVLHRRLQALVFAGTTLFASHPASAQSALDNGAAIPSIDRSIGTISDADLREIAATMDDICLLNKIDVVRWAINRRPDHLGSYAARAYEVVLQRFG